MWRSILELEVQALIGCSPAQAVSFLIRHHVSCLRSSFCYGYISADFIEPDLSVVDAKEKCMRGLFFGLADALLSVLGNLLGLVQLRWRHVSVLRIYYVSGAFDNSNGEAASVSLEFQIYESFATVFQKFSPRLPVIVPLPVLAIQSRAIIAVSLTVQDFHRIATDVWLRDPQFGKV